MIDFPAVQDLLGRWSGYLLGVLSVTYIIFTQGSASQHDLLASLDKLFLFSIIAQAPVVRKMGNSIHWINCYPVDSVVCFSNTYPLDSAIHPSNNRGQVIIEMRAL